MRRTALMAVVAIAALVAAGCQTYPRGTLHVVTKVTSLGAPNDQNRAVAGLNFAFVIYDLHTETTTPLQMPDLGQDWIIPRTVMNSSGLVAVSAYSQTTTGIQYRVFTVDSDSGAEREVMLPGWSSVQLTDLNDDGRLLVEASNGTNTQFFLYRATDGGIIPLDPATMAQALGGTENPITISRLGSGDQILGSDYPADPSAAGGDTGPFVLDAGTMTARRLPAGTTTSDGGVNRVTLRSMNEHGVVVGKDTSCSLTTSTCAAAPYVYDLTQGERLTLPGAPAPITLPVDEAYLVDISDGDIVTVQRNLGGYTRAAPRWYDLAEGTYGDIPEPPEIYGYWLACSVSRPNAAGLVSGMCDAAHDEGQSEFIYRIP